MFDSKVLVRLVGATALFVFLTLLVSTLKTGKTLIIPFVIALVFWYIVITLTDTYENQKLIKIRVPHWLAKVLAIVSVVLVVWIFVWIINNNIKHLIELLPAYQVKIQTILYKFAHQWKIQGLNTEEIINSLNITAFLSELFNGVTALLSYGGTVIIYLIFLLLEYRQFHKKLDNLFTNPLKFKHFRKTLEKINEDAQTYFKIQSFISLLTGICFYIILLVFDIPFAPFWGMLAFILNFIPFLGSIVSTALPIGLGLVELNSLSASIGLGLLLIGTQVLLGNIMLPRLMGKSLNLSPLVILLSLAFWGTIWGIPGMFLSIPIMVILNIILAQFPSTRWLAVMFSGTGKVD